MQDTEPSAGKQVSFASRPVPHAVPKHAGPAATPLGGARLPLPGGGTAPALPALRPSPVPSASAARPPLPWSKCLVDTHVAASTPMRCKAKCFSKTRLTASPLKGKMRTLIRNIPLRNKSPQEWGKRISLFCPFASLDGQGD